MMSQYLKELHANTTTEMMHYKLADHGIKMSTVRMLYDRMLEGAPNTVTIDPHDVARELIIGLAATAAIMAQTGEIEIGAGSCVTVNQEKTTTVKPLPETMSPYARCREYATRLRHLRNAREQYGDSAPLLRDITAYEELLTAVVEEIDKQHGGGSNVANQATFDAVDKPQYDRPPAEPE